MNIPLALFDHELAAFHQGRLKRLLRDATPPSHHDREGLVYVFQGQRFTLSKWRCHKPEVVERIEGNPESEPLTVQQLFEAGMDADSFVVWYAGVVERAGAFRDPYEPFTSPDVWLATLKPIEQEARWESLANGLYEGR